jgi:hypothetical protein
LTSPFGTVLWGSHTPDEVRCPVDASQLRHFLKNLLKLSLTVSLIGVITYTAKPLNGEAYGLLPKASHGHSLFWPKTTRAMTKTPPVGQSVGRPKKPPVRLPSQRLSGGVLVPATLSGRHRNHGHHHEVRSAVETLHSAFMTCPSGRLSKRN